jgi:hypothetical protein
MPIFIKEKVSLALDKSLGKLLKNLVPDQYDPQINFKNLAFDTDL